MLAGEGLHPCSKGVRVAFRRRSARSSTVRSPRPRSWWRATGSGRSSRSTRRSSGSSACRARYQERRGRDPSGLRGRRLRRRIHPRAARARGEDARADRGQPVGELACATMSGMPTTDVNRTIEAVWRIESARLIAGLARIVRDVGLAEDLAQEALVAALEQWPESGVPDNPGAWLMATAKHRAIDRLRRAEVHRAKDAGVGTRATDPRLRRREPRARRPSSTTRSTTTSCASSSPPVTRSSRPRPGSR